MEELVDGNVVSECDYSADDRDLRSGPSSSDRSTPGSALSLSKGVSLIAIVLFSLGLWAAIWAVAASLASSVLR
jgi:hypothetical protein